MELFKIYQTLLNDHTCMVYHGDFNDDITERVISLGQQSAESTGMQKSSRKLSFLMAECFQNIVRHGEQPTMSNKVTNKSGVFMVRNSGSSFYITSANLISPKVGEMLNERLQHINSLDPIELKSLYMDILANEQMNQKGGSGLGLIEMARKSKNNLQFDFQKINDNLTLFYLMVTFSAIEKKGTDFEKKIQLGDSKDLHQQMLEDNVLLAYKGDFAQESVMPLMNMIEQNLRKQAEQHTIKKRLFLVLVEILQNVARHSKRVNNQPNGMLMIAKDEHYYHITTGNLIEKDEQAPLKNTLDNLATKTEDELKAMYKKILREGKVTEKGGAGLGLIDIMRYCKADNVNYRFDNLNNDDVFFTIGVKV